MSRLRSWLLRLAGVFGAGRRDAEILEELRTHRDLATAAYVRSGLPPAEAARRAAAEFGSLAAAAEGYRDQRGVPAAERALVNGRLAVRSLARTPAVTVSMVLVLGLGIGLSTAIAAVFHTIVWAELPVAAPESVMRVIQGFTGDFDRRVQGQVSNFSYPELEGYRTATAVFESLAGVSVDRVAWRRGDGTRMLTSALVTGDYFRVLPIIPARGRLLGAGDTHQPVAVISHRLWLTAFDGADDVVGRPMTLDRSPYTIVGVAPPSFFGTDIESVAVWLPLEAAERARGKEGVLAERNLSWLQLFGRLRPGATPAAAIAEGVSIAALLDHDYPGRRSIIAIARASRIDSGAVRNNRWPLVAATILAAGIQALLFLICGSNAAALLLARGAARQKEIAVRVALGAARAHIIGELAAEVVVLALASTGMGLFVCFAALQALAGMVPMQELLLSIRPDARVFGYALGAALLVALLFGIAPTRQALQVDCLAGLKGEGSAFGRLPALSLRRALIAVQITVSVVLIVLAALLNRAVAQAWKADPGYRPDRVHVVRLDTNWEPGKAPANSGHLSAQIAGALRGAPGVRAVSLATLAPFSGTGQSRASAAASASFERMRFNQVDEHFFAALGVPLVAGRGFLEREDEVVLVNAALARRFWGSEAAAIGRTLFIPEDADKRWATRAMRGAGELVSFDDPSRRGMRVIGVTPTLQMTDVGVADAPTYYTRLTERQERTAVLVVGADPAVPVNDLVLDRLRRVDPDGFATVTRLDERLLARTMPARLGVAAAGLVGLLALVVAAVGIHGVVSYTVASRTKEIGVYQALGARPIDVLRLILGWTLRGVAVGVTAALAVLIALATAFGGPLRGAFNGVHPLDPFAFSVGLLILCAAIGAAAYLPARRAVGLEPLAALRAE